MSKPVNVLIPIYYADGSLYAWASERRFARLQSAGLLARVVRRRQGRICRAILVRRPGDAKPVLSVPTGTRYSFQEPLQHGRAWELRHLGGRRGGKTYAPTEARPAFLRVVADCLVAE